MDANDRLIANIKGLRHAYSESQTELGEAIHVSRQAISNYEKGRRVPSHDVIYAIAKHYLVDVDELLHGDFSSKKKIHADQNAFWNNIEVFFPIVSTETALNNNHFKRALNAHRDFYKSAHLMNASATSAIQTCFSDYSDLAEDEEIGEVAVANLTGLWIMLLGGIKMAPTVISQQPAIVRLMCRKDEKARKRINELDEKELHSALSELDNDETCDALFEMLTVLKKSKEWSELADYYLALLYMWSIVDNDLDLGSNQRVGLEMMTAFLLVGNTYAARYIEFIHNLKSGKMPRNVDKRK